MSGTTITTYQNTGIYLNSQAAEPISLTQAGTILTPGNYAIDVNNAYPGTLTNAGLISGTYEGVYFLGGGAVYNFGTIQGSSPVAYTGNGVKIAGPGLVENSATITGTQDGVLLVGTNGVIATESVSNSGTLLSSAATGGNGVAIYLGQDGTGGVTNTGLIQGAIGADIFGFGTGSLANYGTILGAGAKGYGVEFNSPGNISNASAAIISGGRYGIDLSNDGDITAPTITNNGTIAADGTGINFFGPVHVIDSGLIAGANAAISGIAGSLYLTLVPGASLSGAVEDFDQEGELDLTAGAKPGLLDMGNSFSGFDAISFAAGASWTLEGAPASFQAPEITGFAAGDTIIVEGLSTEMHQFLPGTGLFLNGADVLNFSGSFAANAFEVTSQGGNTTIALATAAQLAAPAFGPASTIGTLGLPGEHDWLAVSLAANQAYEFIVTGLSEYANVSVGTAAAEDEGTFAGGGSGDLGGIPAGIDTVWFTPLTAGIYDVDISDPFAAGGTYAVTAIPVTADYTDNTSTTGTVTVGGPASAGTLSQPGEHDWLAVSLTADQAYEFTTTGLSDYGEVDINTGAYQVSEGSSATGSPPGYLGEASPATQNTWFTPDQTGIYYVDVSDPASIGATYAISAVTESNDYADNDTTMGTLVVNGAATIGTLGAPGEIDWIAVSLAANQAYEFTTTGLSEDAGIIVGTAEILDEGQSAQQSGAAFQDVIGSIAGTQETWFTPDANGIYYVQVQDPETVGGTYAVTAVTEPNDHAGNITTDATLAVGGAPITGTLGVPAENDWLAVSLTANQAYELTVNGLTDYALVQIGAASALDPGSYSPDSVVLSNYGATLQTNHDWFTPETTGLYYVALSDFGGAGDTYAASIAAVPNDFTANTTTEGTVTVGGAATFGTIGVEDEHDWLAISLAANQAYLVTVTGLTDSAEVVMGTAAQLLSYDSVRYAYGDQAGEDATPLPQAVWFTPDTSGTYYIDISDPATVGGTYAVSAFAEPNDYTDNTTTKGTLGFGRALTGGTLVIPDGSFYSALEIDAGAEVTVQSGGSIAAPALAGGTLELGVGSVISGDISFSGTGGRLILDVAGSLPNTITGFAPGDSIKLANVPYGPGDFVTVASPGVLTVDAGGTDYDFHIAGAYVGETGFSISGDLLITEAATCFAAGTGIATPGGRRLVEALRAGDWVETLHAGAQRIRWIGTRAYDGRFIRGNHLALPICIRRDALGEGVPARDLVVSPGHGIYVGGVLVPAWRLVNGVSVTQAESVESVTYFHVELESHEVLLAEHCPAESFLDGAFRGQFQNATDYPDAPRPMAGLERVESGPVLTAIQRRLAGCAKLAPAGMLRGFVEQAGPRRVSGWARDGETPVWLDVLSGGRRVARVLANQYRADLRAAGLGSGNHGFEVALPDWVTGEVEVRRAGGGARLAKIAAKAA